jgi:cell shape-determining protein MreC
VLAAENESRVARLERRVRKLEGERAELRGEVAAAGERLRLEIDELGGENEELVAMVAEAHDELNKSRLANSLLAGQMKSQSTMEEAIQELTEENEVLWEEIGKSESGESPVRLRKFLQDISDAESGQAEADDRRRPPASKGEEEEEEEDTVPEEGEIVDGDSAYDE